MHPSLIGSCFPILLVNETVICLISDVDLDQMKNNFMLPSDQRKPLEGALGWLCR